MSSCLSYSPHRAVRVPFSFLPPTIVISQLLAPHPWPGFLHGAWRALSFQVQFLPFLENPLFLGFRVASVWPSASHCSPVRILPLSSFRPCLALDLSRSLALSLPLSFSRPVSSGGTGPARFPPARGLPSLSQRRVEVSAERGARPPRGVGPGSPCRRGRPSPSFARAWAPRPRAPRLPRPAPPAPPAVVRGQPGPAWAVGGPGRARRPRRRERGGNGPGLALLTGGVAAAAAAAPGRAEGGSERGVGRRKREPGPAERERPGAGGLRSGARLPGRARRERSGQRKADSRSAAAPEPHKGPRLGPPPPPPQRAGLEPAPAGARGERGAGGHGRLRAGSAAGQPQPGEGVRAGVRGCAGALQRCGGRRGGGRGLAGDPAGRAGWRPPRRRGWPPTCSFSGQLICGVEISLRETALALAQVTLAALLSGRRRARALAPEPRRRGELPGRRRSRARGASPSAPSARLPSPRLGRSRARPGALAPLCLPQSPLGRVAAGVGECALLGGRPPPRPAPGGFEPVEAGVCRCSPSHRRACGQPGLQPGGALVEQSRTPVAPARPGCQRESFDRRRVCGLRLPNVSRAARGALRAPGRAARPRGPLLRS